MIILVIVLVVLFTVPGQLAAQNLATTAATLQSVTIENPLNKVLRATGLGT